MTIAKKVLEVAARQTMKRARVAGKQVARNALQQMVVAADAALVDAGRNAKRRQQKRAVKRALKGMGKAVLVAGAAAATVMAVRAGAKKVTA